MAGAAVAHHVLDADYLVVGAGATGMAFVDTLLTESDASVVMVDRRHAPGGHWLDAYPFVQLHMESASYGVASRELGAAVQRTGPEAGMHERASAHQICAYYAAVMQEQLLPSGRVEFFPACDYLGQGQFVSLVSADTTFEVRVRHRIVDATYLASEIPSRTPPRFAVEGGARCVPVNELATLSTAPEGFVIIGAGKTAMDACTWLMSQGVDPDAITWVRPRDAWINNRRFFEGGALLAELVQGVAYMFQAAAEADTLDEALLRLEDFGVIRRLDAAVRPTMCKIPTVADWELEQLRRVRNVVRLGHVRSIGQRQVVLDGGTIPTSPNHLHVHCTASGVRPRSPVPVFRPGAITIQALRAGLPYYGAAVTAYVEAHRTDDTEKNRLCAPNPYPDDPISWARCWAASAAHDRILGAEPDIAAWLRSLRLNISRDIPARSQEPEISQARQRLRDWAAQGHAKLTAFASNAPSPDA